MKISPFSPHKRRVEGLVWSVGLSTLPWIKLAFLSQAGGLLLWNGPASVHLLDDQEDVRIQ